MKPRPIVLPADTMPHDTVIEWWYFNGALEDEDGHRYAFMDCLFRADAAKVHIPYFRSVFAKVADGRFALFAHSLLADLRTGHVAKDVQNVSLGSRDTFRKPHFYANYIDPISFAKGFVAHEMEERAPGTFHVKTGTLDLVMVARRRPMLEGGRGFIRVRGRESFYYSLTDLVTTGLVRRADGTWVRVAGRSWMDHQWADGAYAKDRWTWFSFHLNDGTDLMCVEYDDGAGKERFADMIGPRGRAAHTEDVTFVPGARRMKSAATKAEYPLDWKIEIPARGISLRASAMVRDGEMVFGAINYWEGPVRVEGTVRGRTVKGVGFMELAGYPSDYNYFFLAGQRANVRLQREIGARMKAFFKMS